MPIADELPREQMSLDQVIREHVLLVLGQHNGNRTHAARQLGVCIRTLRKYMHMWNLDIDFPRNHGRDPRPDLTKGP